MKNQLTTTDAWLLSNVQTKDLPPLEAALYQAQSCKLIPLYLILVGGWAQRKTAAPTTTSPLPKSNYSIHMGSYMQHTIQCVSITVL